MAEQSYAQQDIAINTKHGAQIVQAMAAASTPFAYHYRAYANGEKFDYSVTHIPTGLQIPFTFSSPEDCERYIALLMESNQRWERTTYTKAMIRIAHRLHNRMLLLPLLAESEAAE